MKLGLARILFVDDEPLLREIFGEWLASEEHWKVSTAADGEDALEMLKADFFDLLITDVRMPRLSGPALVRRLSELEKSLPSIIFVSGFGDLDEREMYALGVEAFLSKPVRREELVMAVERALAQRSALWQTPMHPGPKQSIVIEADDVCGKAKKGCLVLGRGGFCAPHAQPVSLGKVAFECRVSARQSTIKGEGYVRWRSKAEGMVGIELAYLDEGCRAGLIHEISTINPRSFIPGI
jgi:CheY-like chemotaxis protein